MSLWTVGEHPLELVGPAGRLQAVLTWPEQLVRPGLVAVVCHPHPLHGGRMDNKVVATLVRLCRDQGLPVLRFNFRGVGRSEGRHADAVGEIDDLMAVLTWAQTELGASSVRLAGFSFGSYIAAQAVDRLPELGLSLERLILVAPPVQKYAYPEVEPPAGTLLVQGDADEVVAAEAVWAWAASRQSPPEQIVLAGAGHFFHGRLTELKAELAARLPG